MEEQCAPIGEDIEPIGESRADVYMGNGEDEELLEAEIPSVRTNPKNPTSTEKQVHEVSGQVVYRNRCAALCRRSCVLQIQLLDEEERERTISIVAFYHEFLTQENADTFPILMCRDNRYGQTGATCCERKGPTAYSLSSLVGFIKDPVFRRIILNCGNGPSTKAIQDAVIQACVGADVIPLAPLVFTWSTVVWE